MTVTNFCRRMDVGTKIALERWARGLGADDMTIHRDGSVTLTCEYGYICENYRPTARQLANAAKKPYYTEKEWYEEV